MMVTFIDDHRADYGVEPMCKVLPIAPSTYYEHVRCRRDPELRSARAKRDEVLEAAVRPVWEANRGLYGGRKVWHQLRREDVSVARCTVQRLMKGLGRVRARLLHSSRRSSSGSVTQANRPPENPAQSTPASRRVACRQSMVTTLAKRKRVAARRWSEPCAGRRWRSRRRSELAVALLRLRPRSLASPPPPPRLFTNAFRSRPS